MAIHYLRERTETAAEGALACRFRGVTGPAKKRVIKTSTRWYGNRP